MITRIAAAHVGERIAVFTHAGVIGEALSQASGAEPFAFIGPNNASISQILVTPDRWVVRRFNDASHLERG
jgi:probable phosphoglycerate mutase